MALTASTLWWLTAGALVAAELASGTFYLLMVALGCVAGALAALAGLALAPQIVWAALIGGGATAGWHLRRRGLAPAVASARNRDVNLDIGQTVQVSHWAEDGSARVLYRGASWSARHAGSGVPAPGPHVIVALLGSELQVKPSAP